MATITYDKLVRDNIPAIIESAGKTCVVEEMDDERYFAKLIEKLHEELQEFEREFDALNDENAIKELADLEEVLLAIVDGIGVSRESFERIRLAKLSSNGGFEKKLLLKEVIDKQ